MRHVLRRLIPPRLRPVARELYDQRRQVGYVGVAVVLFAALGVAVATGSWIGAIAVFLVSLVVAQLEMRRVRRAHDELSDSHGELSRAVGTLALKYIDSADPDGFPVELVPYVVDSLVERDDVMDAYALLTRRSTATDLPLPIRRRLWEGLQRQGYLSAALAVAEACVADPAGRPDRPAYERLKGEIAVLSNRPARVPRIARPARFAPVSGRVLHLVGSSLPLTQTGYSVRTHYTALAQAASGLDPHVVTQMGYGTDRFTASHRTLDGVIYHRVPGPPRGSMPLDEWLARHAERTAKLVARLRPAVLHAASDYLNAVTARALGDAFGLPVVYESRGFWEETWLSRQAQTFGWDLARVEATYGLPDAYLLRREIEDRCRREADRVVTLADTMANRIAAGAVDPDRITVIPNGVDVDAFPVQTRHRALAASLGISDDTVVIGYISSIVEYEGIDTLIDAYASVRATSRARLALLIVGDGDELGVLKRRAAGLGLGDAVFTGRVPHDRVLDYYSLIDVFVVPRKPVEVCHLVTPLKPFEALATGRTLVMSNVRALAAIAGECQAAELFEAGSSDSLAKTLTALLEDEPRRRRLAAAGATWVRAHRTWAANAEAYLRVYAELGAASR